MADLAEQIETLNRLLQEYEGYSYANGYLVSMMQSITRAYVPVNLREELSNTIDAHIKGTEDLIKEKNVS